MKLITKINLNFISAAAFILFAGCVIFYVLLRNITLNNIDRELERYKKVTQGEFEELLSYPERFVYFDVLINIQQTNSHSTDQFSDTTLAVKQEKGYFRKLKFTHDYSSRTYQVEIFRSLRHADELTIRLLFVLCCLIIFFMLSFYLLNRYVAMQSLEGFFETIAKIRNIKVDRKENLDLPQTDIDEFEQLNKVLYQITERIRRDFFNLKEFTENASHEIQTPLAIISTKLDQMFQDDTLTEGQLLNLVTIQEAVDRLSKLNKALLLLTKIENDQFAEVKQINIADIIRQQLENLYEFIEDKEISVKLELAPANELSMNPYLAELLIFNLLKNSIRHNLQQGELHISLQKNHLVIKNHGVGEALDTERVFERFAKGSHSKSMGLGLAIVKKICDMYQIEIQYSYTAPFHCMAFSFQSFQTNQKFNNS